MKALLLIAFLILAQFTGNAANEVPIALAGSSVSEISKSFGYAVPSTSDLTPEEALNLKFIPCKKNLLAFGFDSRTYWFKATISNRTGSKNLLLEIPFAPLDFVTLYVKDKDGNWTETIDGDRVPASMKAFPYLHPVLPLTIGSEAPQEILLKVQTSSSLQLPVRILQAEHFYQKASQQQLVQGLFFGAIVLMLLYQLFRYWNIRDRIILYYTATLVSLVLFVAYFQGYITAYLIPEIPALNHWVASLIGPVFLICSSSFAIKVLDLKENARTLYYLMIINMVLSVVAATVMIIQPALLTYSIHHWLVIVGIVLSLSGAVQTSLKRNKSGYYYLASWVLAGLSIVLFASGNIGLLDINFDSGFVILELGYLAQILIIAFHLSIRWKELLENETRLREQELHRAEFEKSMLESEVERRTNEINRKTLELEETIKIKDKFLSVVTHDLKGPLSTLQMTLSLLKSESITPNELRELAGSLEKRFENTSVFIQNLLEWAKLQLVNGSFQPTAFDMQKTILEVVHLLEPEATRKLVRLESTVQSPAIVFGDLNMIRFILRNLISNSIKFSNGGNEIVIGAEQGDRYLTFLVKDSGTGIPEKIRDKLFTLDTISTPGTQAEKGTGLGLMVTKEFIDRNQGLIWYESREGKGTTFYFSLPQPTEAPALSPAESRLQKTLFQN